MLKSFYGAISPLSAAAGFIVGIKDAQAGILLMLGAILFHMWSNEDESC
jgi:hypothetical protein